MLYMVIVPVIPDYLRKIGAYDTHIVGGPENVTYQVAGRIFSNNDDDDDDDSDDDDMAGLSRKGPSRSLPKAFRVATASHLMVRDIIGFDS